MKIEEIVVSFTPDTKKLDKSLKRVEKQLKGFGKIGKANNKIFGDFLRLAGFAGLTKMSIDATHLAHNLTILGQKTGMATSEVSKLRNAWASFGADAKSFDAFSKKMYSDLANRFSAGGSALESALATIGSSGFDEMGKLRSMRDILGDIAEYMKYLVEQEGMEVGVAQSEIEQIFGVPFEVSAKMAGGRESFFAYLEEGIKHTGNITDENIKTLNEFGIAINRYLTAMNTSFQNSLGVVVSTTKLIEKLNEVSKFFAATPDFFVKALGAPGEALYESGRWIYELFGGSDVDNVTPKYSKRLKELKSQLDRGTIDVAQFYEAVSEDEELKRAALFYSRHGFPDAVFGEGGYFTTKDILEYFAEQDLGYVPTDLIRAEKSNNYTDSHNTTNINANTVINGATPENAREMGQQAGNMLVGSLVGMVQKTQVG